MYEKKEWPDRFKYNDTNSYTKWKQFKHPIKNERFSRPE